MQSPTPLCRSPNISNCAAKDSVKSSGPQPYDAIDWLISTVFTVDPFSGLIRQRFALQTSCVSVVRTDRMSANGGRAAGRSTVFPSVQVVLCTKLNIRGLIHNRCVHTKQAWKMRMPLPTQTLVFIQTTLTRECPHLDSNCDPFAWTFWRRENDNADVRWWTEEDYWSTSSLTLKPTAVFVLTRQYSSIRTFN